MALDQRLTGKISKNARREEAPGVRVDPYIYEGRVKNNLDPTRTGRLQVWIADLGGIEEDPKNWRTVSYASPFMGTTDVGAVDKNTWDNTPHTYGMWMVPPDIGVSVLCIFVAGDPMRGYWIACVNPKLSRYMLPGLASAAADIVDNTNKDITGTYDTRLPAPVTEFNENDSAYFNTSDFINIPKPIHEPQYQILKQQGLDRDDVRGTITSSSQRESPSNVFGISTPGRPNKDPADDPAFLDKVANDSLTEADYAYKTRKGGHTFVMDDGSVLGADQLVRLRTASGHQIMMHDTAQTIYISHSDGSSWMEFTADGAVNLFSENGVAIRTKGTLNFHADQDINFNAGRNIGLNCSGLESTSASTLLTQGTLTLQSTQATNIKTGTLTIDASGKISVKSGGIIALNASGGIFQQSGRVDSLSTTATHQLHQLSETGRAEVNGLWVSVPNILQTLVTTAPTHEPYDRGTALQAGGGGANTNGIQPAMNYSGTNDQTKNLAGTGVKNPATAADLRNQPKCDCTIGNLTADQLTAYYAQLGKSESSGSYTTVNNIGYVGKYQFGYKALQDLGYVSKSCKSNAGLSNPNNWSPRKNGVDSLQSFLNNNAEQESAVCEFTKRNYASLCANGTLTQDLPPEEQLGLLNVSHLLGPGEPAGQNPKYPNGTGTWAWRQGRGGSDQNGTTGDQYFQNGKYAATVLAPKVATLDSPPKTA